LIINDKQLPNVWHGKEPCHQKLHHLITTINHLFGIVVTLFY
jgi:hypothetical protein